VAGSKSSLQAGLAARAEAILVPEIGFDVKKVAAKLTEREAAGRRPSLVVAAEGARSIEDSRDSSTTAADALRKSLSPLADPGLGQGARVIDRSGTLAQSLALGLQRLTDLETLPFSIGQLVRGGGPTVVDRQLGLAYGTAAVQALREGQSGVMVAFEPPDIRFVPLSEAINKVRTVPPDSEFVRVARALGVCLGD
jgi:6-phosphofructokinase 1